MCTMHIHLDCSQTRRQTYVQAAANNYMHHGLACLPLITALSCCQLVASVGKHNVLFIAKVVWCILFSFFGRCESCVMTTSTLLSALVLIRPAF